MSMPHIAPTLSHGKSYEHMMGSEKKSHMGSQSKHPTGMHKGHPMHMAMRSGDSHAHKVI